MPLWKGIVGKSFSKDAFRDYCSQLHWDSWRPSFIVLHNTAVPSLSERPNGLTFQNIKNLEIFYRDTRKWSAGPHLFIDDKQIWVFTPLTVSGVHSPSWNSIALGIEMLGDYSRESFSQGRGLKVRQNAVAAMNVLYSVLGIDPHTMKLHREDPLTTHACPGNAVRKLEIIQDVQDVLIANNAGEHSIKALV
ncbi:MAG: N-acetylmuramoyl-L-alanine amidase [Ginsengibacter sp.]